MVGLAPLPGIPWMHIVEETWETIRAGALPCQWTAAALMVVGLLLALAALVAAGRDVVEGKPFRPLAEGGPPDPRVLTRAVNGVVARLSAQQEALRDYARQEVVGRPVRQPADLELVVRRVCQEALSNVRKHAAGATRVNVALFCEGWEVMLIVEDDGPGFAATEPGTARGEERLGLTGMRERAALLHGAPDVTSAPGQGTTGTLSVPHA